jgi:hypothetical protein
MTAADIVRVADETGDASWHRRGLLVQNSVMATGLSYEIPLATDRSAQRGPAVNPAGRE